MTKPNYTVILPNLWVGNKETAEDEDFLKGNGINVVIKVAQYQIKVYPKIVYHMVNVSDDEICNLNDVKGLFEMTSDLINDNIENKKILVVCKMGNHRSATIIAHYMIKYLQVPFINTILYINNLRLTSLRRNTCILQKCVKHLQESGIDVGEFYDFGKS